MPHDDGFTKTQLHQLQTLFLQERQYMRQLIQDELADIRARLERLDERTDDESSLHGKEIVQLRKRLTRAEKEIAELKNR